MLDLKFKESDEFDIFGHIVVYLDDKRVGIAKLSRKENVATLIDITIHSDKKKIAWFLPFKRKVNYRNKGIGSKLLKNVIDFCKKKNIKIIKGKIGGNPEILVPWYEKNGFLVNEKQELYMKLD